MLNQLQSQKKGDAGDAPDATLVSAPLFDETAARTARPVVPLTHESPVHSGAALPFWSLVFKQRRSWTLALILASALIGSVLGGVGLRYYQHRQRANRFTEGTPVPGASPFDAAQTPLLQPPAASAAAAPADDLATISDSSPPAETSGLLAGEAEEMSPGDEERFAAAGQPKEDDDDNPEANDDQRAPRLKRAGEAQPQRARAATRPPLAAGDNKNSDDGSDDRAGEAAAGGGDGDPRGERPRRAAPSASTNKTVGDGDGQRRPSSDDDAGEASDDDGDPGPRRIDRVRDIFGPEARPRRGRPRQRSGRTPADDPQDIFEGREP